MEQRGRAHVSSGVKSRYLLALEQKDSFCLTRVGVRVARRHLSVHASPELEMAVRFGSVLPGSQTLALAESCHLIP